MITALLEMCFANVEGGLEVNLDKLSEQDIVKILFAENPGILVQVKDKKAFEKLMEEAGVGFAIIAKPTSERHILVSKEVRPIPLRHRLHARRMVRIIL